MSIDFRAELDSLREQGADGTAAVKHLKALGATDSEARRAIADRIIENRRAEQARLEAAAQQQTEESRPVSNLPETVTIRTADYLELLKSDLTLTELNVAGVDNWDGYDYVDHKVIAEALANACSRLSDLIDEELGTR